jgi:Zn-dependent peptidase ImmA (M78 family)/transcriptional regulator with XRE-family HTH domain
MSAQTLSSIDPTVIGVRLAEARSARGLTQQQVADSLGVARTTITAIEKGIRAPRAEELVQMATLYGRQVGSLVRPPSTSQVSPFIVQFRAARVPAGAKNNAQFDDDIRMFQQLCEDYAELEHLLDSPMARRYPDQYDIRSTAVDIAAEEIAASERNRLGLGDGPLTNLWGLLESDVGLRIFAPRLSSSLAGLFAYTDELGGCIAVNANHPEERRRWTATHEYAHFLTDRYRAEITTLPAYRRIPETERFADSFARSFLMPTSGLVRRFQAQKRAKSGVITPADVLMLCQQYVVSFQAMVLRLEDLKLLPSGTWEYLRDEGFKPQSARKHMDLAQPAPERSMLPLRYEILAVQAYTRGLLSEGRLAQFLRTDRLGARKRVQELTESSPYDEDGEWFQAPLDLNRSLADRL